MRARWWPACRLQRASVLGVMCSGRYRRPALQEVVPGQPLHVFWSWEYRSAPRAASTVYQARFSSAWMAQANRRVYATAPSTSRARQAMYAGVSFAALDAARHRHANDLQAKPAMHWPARRRR
ncbi:hypothetical protein XAC3723 [Xanthomonas citri pv. citri str. 306]|uniref:Uncharacterized protein n=1 Tax=Xanthomonas axonopodis pv. citri (strain 306) TaxID=190486 RepID=A0AAI7ZI84_XANAC|nr:hypothetical protein XAC3723 [Xanthomonas citri pv. citri str. 306]